MSAFDSSFTSEAILEATRRALELHSAKKGALLPVLHELQDCLGFIPALAEAEIAHALNLSRAEVHGVVTYYEDFKERPGPAYVMRICRAEACQSMGGQQLLEQARQQLQCDGEGVSADGKTLVEAVYCLGLCASSPALMCHGDLHARVTPQRLAALLGSRGGAA